MGIRSRAELYLLLFADQRTGQIGNQFIKNLGDDSGAVIPSYLQDIYCILYQSMLESASSAQIGNFIFPGDLNSVYETLSAVRRTGGTPDPVILK